jgi:hypothetical protein
VNRQPKLKEISYALSAVCSACGDWLLTQSLSADEHSIEDVRKQLDILFEHHVAQKHPDHST